MKFKAKPILKSLLRIAVGTLIGFIVMVVAYLIIFATPRHEGVNTTVERKELRFYRTNGEWYADVLEHSQAENRMVAGADDLLDLVAGDDNEVRISFSSDIPQPADWKMHLHLFAHDKHGATYRVTRAGSLIPVVAWLCNVTHTVFGGEHPTDIYIHDIKTSR